MNRMRIEDFEQVITDFPEESEGEEEIVEDENEENEFKNFRHFRFQLFLLRLQILRENL